MKKNVMRLFIGLVAAWFLVACGGSDNKTADVVETTTEQVFPECSITQGVPLTDSQITVHVICTGGNVVINEATVTVDGQVKSLDFEGASIDDYIGFRNLQDDTVYTVVMEAIVDGNVFTDSVDVRTKDIPVVVTPPGDPDPAPSNQSPTANAGANKSIEVAHSVSITGSGTDTDGSIVSYEWKEGSSVLGNTDTISYTPSTVGTHTLTLTVTDDDGATGTDTMVVTSTATPPPVISNPVINSIPTQNVDDNGGGLATTLLTVKGTGFDANAEFSIVNDPTSGALTIGKSSGTLVYDGDINPSQTYTITIKVLNPDDGGNDTEKFTLNVNDNL